MSVVSMSVVSSTARRLWQRSRQLARRLGKTPAFLAAAVGYTLYAGVSVRRKHAGGERPRARALHQQRGARLLLRVLGVRVRMGGNARALTTDDDRPRLLVCNHLGDAAFEEGYTPARPPRRSE